MANQIKAEQNARKSIDDKLKEKNEELKTALVNEDYTKAEQLKKDIAQLEKDKARLVELEENKKIAIFEERYDDVIALERQINNLKKGTLNTTIPHSNTDTTPSQSKINLSEAKTPFSYGSKNGKKISLSDVDYSDKIISRIGIGFGSYTYSESNYDYYSNSTYYTDYDESLIGLNYIEDRWWINKYLVGGWSIDYATSDYGSINYGGQITALGDFDAILLPYTSFGLGLGYHLWDEEIYLPVVYRVGTNLFFNKQRSVGLFTEFNIYFNNENMPKLRFGVVWSSIKRRAKK